MTIELKVANVDLAVTQEGDPIRVQIGASGINPVGAVKPAASDFLGIAPTLRFDSGVESIAGVSVAIPDKADKSKVVACRVGWAATTNTGDVVWTLRYQWVSLDTPIDAAEDGSISGTETVNVVTSGYAFTSIEIPAPVEANRVLRIQIGRDGDEITDTCAGEVHVVGILFDFVAGP